MHDRSGTPSLASLCDIRIIDAATLLAGPLAASLLGDLGAEVIKVERPGAGDPLRGYPPFKDGVSLIHKVTNRNKSAITLDLGRERGRESFFDLVEIADIVILNFRPQTLEKWRLTHEALSARNPRIITLMVSAFGATGPYRDRPGFARVAEGFSGLAHVTGDPQGPPVLSGYPIVDAVTGLFGAFSLLAALRERDVDGHGCCVDLALYEPLLRLMEDMVIPVEFGEQRARSGNANPFVAPNDLYTSRDGQFLVLPISTDQMFARLVRTMGRDDLIEAYASNADRVAGRSDIDVVIKNYMGERKAEEILAELISAEVPVGLVNGPTDIVGDPHISERGNLVRVYDDECGAELTMQAPLPLGFGTVRHAGRRLGEDNSYVFQSLLQYDEGHVQELAADGVI